MRGGGRGRGGGRERTKGGRGGGESEPLILTLSPSSIIHTFPQTPSEPHGDPTEEWRRHSGD